MICHPSVKVQSPFYLRRAWCYTAIKGRNWLLTTKLTGTALDKDNGSVGCRKWEDISAVFRVSVGMRCDSREQNRERVRFSINPRSRPVTLTSEIDATLPHFQIKEGDIWGTLNGCNQPLIRVAPTIVHETQLQYREVWELEWVLTVRWFWVVHLRPTVWLLTSLFIICVMAKTGYSALKKMNRPRVAVRPPCKLANWLSTNHCLNEQLIWEFSI